MPSASRISKKDALVIKTHQPLSVVQFLLNGGGQLSVAEDDLGARTKLAPGANQALPLVVALVSEQQNLADTAGGAVADEASGEDAGVIQHQTVSRTEKFGQVIEVVVAGLTGLFIQSEKPGSIPALQRSLSNQLLGKIEVKIRGFQESRRPNLFLIGAHSGTRIVEFTDFVVGEAQLGHGIGAKLAHANLVAPASAVKDVRVPGYCDGTAALVGAAGTISGAPERRWCCRRR